jgi:hypothetical protein
MINPPIRWKLVNDSGRLDLEIEIGWSAWVETGSAEAELWLTCLQELEKQGWKEARETSERLAVSGERRCWVMEANEGERRCWVMEANEGDFEKENISHD